MHIFSLLGDNSKCAYYFPNDRLPLFGKIPGINFFFYLYRISANFPVLFDNALVQILFHQSLQFSGILLCIGNELLKGYILYFKFRLPHTPH